MNTSVPFISALLLSLVVCMVTAEAQTPIVQTTPPTQVWVDDDFNSSTPGWQVTHFDQIQDGIDAVAEGGEVIVYAGTYNEDILLNKTVTLQTWTPSPAQTRMLAMLTT